MGATSALLGGGANAAMGAAGGFGLAEGIYDWRNTFFGQDHPSGPAPEAAPGSAQVHLDERAVAMPGGHLLDEVGQRHWWLQTPDREAGMGSANGVPGDSIAPPLQTQITDQRGQADRPGVTRHDVPGVDPARVDALLEDGRPTGPWIPFLNDCNQVTDDVLADAGGDRRNWDSPDVLHARALHDVIAGRAPEGQTEVTEGLGAGGAALGAAAPTTAPWLAGAGAAAYLSGTEASRLEAQGNTTAAEGVSVAGMGASGAMLGAGIGSIVPAVGTAVGAGVGGGLGLAAGGALSLFGDESPDSERLVGPEGHSVSAEETVGIGGMAAGGALLGATIGSVVPAVGTAIGAAVGGGLGGLTGLVASLWD
jgi:hypothetical protein